MRHELRRWRAGEHGAAQGNALDWEWRGKDFHNCVVGGFSYR